MLWLKYVPKKKICDTESINIWILAEEAYHFTDFLLLCHHDVITILHVKVCTV